MKKYRVTYYRTSYESVELNVDAEHEEAAELKARALIDNETDRAPVGWQPIPDYGIELGSTIELADDSNTNL